MPTPIMTLRVDDKTKAEWAEKAMDAGLSVSEWLRALASGASVYTPGEVPASETGWVDRLGELAHSAREKARAPELTILAELQSIREREAELLARLPAARLAAESRVREHYTAEEVARAKAGKPV